MLGVLSLDVGITVLIGDDFATSSFVAVLRLSRFGLSTITTTRVRYITLGDRTKYDSLSRCGIA